jgi:hypothetical protein
MSNSISDATSAGTRNDPSRQTESSRWLAVRHRIGRAETIDIYGERDHSYRTDRVSVYDEDPTLSFDTRDDQLRSVNLSAQPDWETAMSAFEYAKTLVPQGLKSKLEGHQLRYSDPVMTVVSTLFFGNFSGSSDQRTTCLSTKDLPIKGRIEGQVRSHLTPSGKYGEPFVDRDTPTTKRTVSSLSRAILICIKQENQQFQRPPLEEDVIKRKADGLMVMALRRLPEMYEARRTDEVEKGKVRRPHVGVWNLDGTSVFDPVSKNSLKEFKGPSR